MATPTQTKCWVLANKPTKNPTLEGAQPTFTLKTENLPPLTANQLLVKTLYLSNDPAQRTWVGANVPEGRLYTKPIDVGQVMGARGIGEVIESTSAKAQKGDHVLISAGWTEYAVVGEDQVSAIESLPGGLSETHYLGALGGTGLTAYYGLLVQGEAKRGDKVVVSGAAGATGSMVVQIAKHILGAGSVIGIAGSDQKCLNYKSPSFAKDLRDATDANVDVYFDNVGGEILDMMLPLMALHGRIAACGAISAYNGEDALPLKNWFQVITMRLRIHGFIVLDYLNKAPEVRGVLKQAIADGKLRVDEKSQTVVSSSFEDIPRVWMKLFEGGNTGKLVTRL
ncbi:hypothetical protein FE257_008982 [Aspergillus nanangensis]|uniref:Enoyl reductase (ER) domain-containing protein n=1 Tax=Aspergillus nanangensis TaxID=2582783 RepID=A0AAD4GYK2_ASPNN|nr:hypothetical protein FE257_008982 [Aspergillus nanangensis]